MKNFIIIIACISIFTACSKQCKIDGSIANAEGETILLEHTSLNAHVILDSAKIQGSGDFSFKVQRPEYPEFYKIILGKRSMVIALDSLSDHVTINADANNFDNPVIGGSDDSNDILKLRQSSFRLQSIAQRKDTGEVSLELKRHKDLARKIVMKNTRSAAAYYAINQMINGYYYMSPYVKEDLPYWSAVATAYDLYYPKYDRAIELKQSTLMAINNARESQASAENLLNNIGVEGFIEIELPNRIGELTKLSSLKGSAVLIDFSAYASEQSTAHTLFLRGLLDKYGDYGFNIYQISLDSDKLLWLEKTKDLPWICVRDANSLDSKYLTTYNVTKIPTFFLLSKQGDIIGRFNYENVEDAIDKLFN